MDAAACAVGRIGPDGPWIGFAPAIDDRYELVIGPANGVPRHVAADADDLLCLAAAYFEDDLGEPPEELAATHGDIGSLVRHVAEHEADPERRRLLGEAVDAIDDGLPADAVVSRLRLCLAGSEDPLARLTRRVNEISGRSVTP
jgi:ribosomal protein S15P/S13E